MRMENRKPHGILVLTNDPGNGDLGCAGNPRMITPLLKAILAAFLVAAAAVAADDRAPKAPKAPKGATGSGVIRIGEGNEAPALDLNQRKRMQPSAKYANYRKVVAETHKASLAIRKRALHRFLTTEKRFPPNKWGENLWCLTALYLNQKVDEANAILYERAKAFVDATDAPGYVAPHEKHVGPEWPFGFFSIGEYFRTYALFHSASAHFPGRLEPGTEAVMKEVFWRFVKRGSVVKEAGPEFYLSYYGTENHDLVQRPYFYLMNGILKDDPNFNRRKYNDGKTAQAHYDAYHCR